MRRAVATRLRTRRLLVKSTLPPLTFFSGQSPSQDANAEAFRNRDTSVPISHRIVCAVIALIPGTFVRSTPNSGVDQGWIKSSTALWANGERATQKEIIYPERNSLVEDLCGNGPGIGGFTAFKLIIINRLT
jgi:hypothetical protein